MSSTSTPKQRQVRRRINNNSSHQSRNANAYIDRDDYHRPSFVNGNNYWNHDYHRSNDEFYLDEYYQHSHTYPSTTQHIRKGRLTKHEQQYHSKAFSPSSSNNSHAYYDHMPPRLRHPQEIDQRESRPSNLSEPIKLSKAPSNDEQAAKPSQSPSSSSTNSELTNNVGSTNRKELYAKNLAAAAIAARQQHPQPQTNLGVVQALMNSLIVQQQQQQPAQSQSTVQLQYQLTNALLATMIQQRLKESMLQAQAQQIQAALPTLLAAQALVYQQQQGPTAVNPQSVPTILPPYVAHPGTKFNNRPLVKFPVARPTIPPGMHTQPICSTTALPTYQQIQEIERGISLDQAIHLKNAIDITDVTPSSMPAETDGVAINASPIIE